MDSLALKTSCPGCKQRDDLNRILAHGVEQLQAQVDELLKKVRGIAIDEPPVQKRRGAVSKSIIKRSLGNSRAERKANFAKLSQDAG